MIANWAELDEVEVRIEKLVAGGDGLGRVDGMPLFVPRTAPGDLVRVRISERRPDYGRGEVVALLEPGPHRRSPPCPHFSRCGGCALQHLEDAEQTRLKAEAALETLERIAGLARPGNVEVLAGAPWAYRLRTQLHVDPPAVGYFARKSHDLVAVAVCPILVPELEALLPGLAATLAAMAAPPRRLDLAAGDEGRVASGPPLPGLPGGELAARIGDFVYNYDARVFFQGHRQLLPDLVARVVGPWTGAAAYDLFAGVGLFSLPLARRYARVAAVEGNALAARFARNNLRKNGVDNVEVVARSLEGWMRSLPADVDRVVVDPPREGLSVVVRRVLADRAPRRLTYVSCHTAALARDLRDFLPSYRLQGLHLIDLFPQSGHIEAVVQLERT